MKAHQIVKKTITAVLLLFVTVTVGYLLYDRGRQAGRAEAEASRPKPEDNGSVDELEPGVRTVTAYYFFMKPRCATCNNIEKYAMEAVAEGFPDEVGAGLVKFVAVDCDKPENEHYLTDYMLETKALVLVAREKDKPDDWRNLKEIWDHVSDKPVYLTYVRNEISDLLNPGQME